MVRSLPPVLDIAAPTMRARVPASSGAPNKQSGRQRVNPQRSAHPWRRASTTLLILARNLLQCWPPRLVWRRFSCARPESPILVMDRQVRCPLCPWRTLVQGSQAAILHVTEALSLDEHHTCSGTKQLKMCICVLGTDCLAQYHRGAMSAKLIIFLKF